MKRNYPSIIITPEGEKWLDKGQMWMYKNNLGSLDDSIENGSFSRYYDDSRTLFRYRFSF